LPAGPNYDNVNGWSKRTIGGDVIRESAHAYIEKDSSVTIELGGEELTFVMNDGFIDGTSYIDVVRSGRTPERIWYLDEQPHHVIRAEYQQILGGR
jgi:hypothetical protein